MKKILLEEKYILEYIKDSINEIKEKTFVIENAKYHHNTSYDNAPSICKHGILTMLDLQKYGLVDYTDEQLKKFSDIESHVNGIDSISLAVVGLDDIYYNEDVYDPFDPKCIDFLVCSSIKAGRSSIHYGNEFLSNQSISIDKLKSIDIRLLKYIQILEAKNNYSIKDVIKKYNYLKEIAIAIKQMNLDIPIREMSVENSISLDIDKLSDIPKLVLK